MKSVWKILVFEYLNCVRNKAFIIVTAVLVGMMLLASFVPGIIEGMAEGDDTDKNESMILAVNASEYDDDLIKESFGAAFEGYEVKITDEDAEALKSKVENRDYAKAVYMDSPISFSFITETVSLTNNDMEIVYETIRQLSIVTNMNKAGISQADAAAILGVQIKAELVTTGNDQTKNFLPAYIIMIVLFACIASYGQFVAQSVVSEKNTRAMELLITCAKPKHLIFGKVIGSGLAGLTQMSILLLTALAAFGPASTTKLPDEIREFFVIAPQTVVLAIVFFLLGYFIYAFLLGALASFASKSEDLNNLTSPIIMILTLVYAAVVFCCTSDNIDNTFMKVLSFVPFSAPMAMLVRATILDVPLWEIIVSVVIQAVTVYLLGLFAAAVYKIGVLMYGNPPKIGEIFKMLGAAIKEDRKKKK